DILFARGSGIKKLLDFKIYNRLGQLLFMTTDENFGWDGIYKGVDQNTDSYFYTYRAEAYIPGKIVSGEGNFMLLR
ncbi:MAG: PKD domain-containing protein, partial [Chitinophagales bacterium]